MVASHLKAGTTAAIAMSKDGPLRLSVAENAISETCFFTSRSNALACTRLAARSTGLPLNHPSPHPAREPCQNGLHANAVPSYAEITQALLATLQPDGPRPESLFVRRASLPASRQLHPPADLAAESG